MRNNIFIGLFFVSAGIFTGFTQESASVGIDDTRPMVEDVGVSEHLGEDLDLTLSFTNEEGERVQLEDYIRGDIPVVLAPVYYSCPGLCTAVLNGITKLIEDLDLELGKDYRIVNVSFDPENTPLMAKLKRTNYADELKNSEAAVKHWHFLTGESSGIDPLMTDIGFRYKKLEDQYSHASVLVLITPNGKINRYIYGVSYPAKDVRLALIEAAQGKIGNTFDQIIIYCFRFDPRAGKYVPVAWKIMRIGALLSLLVLVAVGGFLWRGEFFKKTEAVTDV